MDCIGHGDGAVQCTYHSWTVGPWGDLLSTAAKIRGSTGTIVDAVVRDVKRIVAMGFPTFARGIMPLDSWGRGFVADVDVTIQCGGVEVQSGDLVFGDYDGVVVIPKAVEDEVLERAFRKVTSENHTRDQMLQGSLLANVYEKYGVR